MGSFLPWNLAMNLNPELRLEQTPATDPQSQVTQLHRLTPCHFIQYVTVLTVPWCLRMYLGSCQWKSTKIMKRKLLQRISYVFFLGIQTGQSIREITSISGASPRWRRNRRIWGSSSGVARPMKCTHSYTPPPKTNMTMENHPFLNRRYIFKWLVFHCHVSFQLCSP